MLPHARLCYIMQVHVTLCELMLDHTGSYLVIMGSNCTGDNINKDHFPHCFQYQIQRNNPSIIKNFLINMNSHFIDDYFCTTPLCYDPIYTRHPILDLPLQSYPQNIIPEMGWSLSPDHIISQLWWFSHDLSESDFCNPTLLSEDNSVVDHLEEQTQVSILFSLILFFP